MNFLKQIVAFEKLSESREISANARSMYYSLLYKNNSLGWIEQFTMPNTVLQATSSIKYRDGFFKARQQLIEANLINYKKGKTGKAGAYSIKKLYDEVHDDVQVEVHDEVHDKVQHEVHDEVHDRVHDDVPLNKLNKTKQNKTKLNDISKKNIIKKKSDSVVLTDNPTPPVVACKEIIGYLNNKLGTNYKDTTVATRRLVNARMNEGYTVDDFKQVIDKKYKEWGNDEDMSAYLRPNTLFSNKFESYLNQLVVKQSKQRKYNNYEQREQRDAEEYLSLIE